MRGRHTGGRGGTAPTSTTQPRPVELRGGEGGDRIAGVDEEKTSYRVVLEPQPDGCYTAYVPCLPGCVSEGASRDEALANVREAIALYKESLSERGCACPEVEEHEVTI